MITNFNTESHANEGDESYEVGEHLYQEFIKVDAENYFSSSPEISAIALSHDKKFLCAGTIQANAKLILWEICSKTCLKNIPLLNASIITHIKIAYDSRHICCIVK